MPQGRVEVGVFQDGVIEVRCVGHMGRGVESYLTELETRVRTHAGPTSVLYEATGIDGYEFAFAQAHVKPFRAWLGKLHRVAIVHKMPGMGFAIAAISMASSAQIKGFATRDEALAWLREA